MPARDDREDTVAHGIPAPLADPPWLSQPPVPAPVVLSGLICADQPSIHWCPGEREQWRAAVGTPHPDTRWDRVADQVVGRSRFPFLVFGHAPDPVARRVLYEWEPGTCTRRPWYPDRFLRAAVARFEVEALEMVLKLAATASSCPRPRQRNEMMRALSRLVQPLTSPQVALLMADWADQLRGGGAGAGASPQTWLLRHPAAAARALVPAALSEPGAERRAAEDCLRFLSTHGHADTVRTAATGHGPAAARAVRDMLAPVPRRYGRPPPIPAWASPRRLPPVLLRDGGAPLPAAAVSRLVTMFALSTLAEPCEGLAEVIAACTPESLAAFAWSLFQGALAHLDGNLLWTLTALGLVGDDDTVRRLFPLVHTLPESPFGSTNVLAVEVLGAIGTGVALDRLDQIARLIDYRPIRRAAVRHRDALLSHGVTPVDAPAGTAGERSGFWRRVPWQRRG
jgi:hypothetical protein